MFTPVYSPTMNPVELCFNHLKTLLRSPELRAVAEAILMSTHNIGFYEEISKIIT